MNEPATRPYSRGREAECLTSGRPTWQLLAIVTLSLVMELIVAWSRFDSLWFIDEENYLAHGVRIVHNSRIGWRIDNWQPPLSYLLHSSLLLFHPTTPNLTGPVVQHPDLPISFQPVSGKKNPVGLDSSAWQVQQAVEGSGGRFDRYVFWARVPMALLAAIGLLALWYVLDMLGADPLPGVALLALTPTFVVEQVRIIADPLISVVVIAMIWAAIAFSRRPVIANAVTFGAACGVGVGSKLSIVPLLPAFVLAIASWRRFFSLTRGYTSAPNVYRILSPATARVAVIRITTMGLVAFVTLWAAYGFQVGTLSQLLTTQRMGTEDPRLLQRFPALGNVMIPMPSFVLMFVTNSKIAADQLNLKIDGVKQVPWWRKAQHYGAMLVSTTSVFLSSLALIAVYCMACDPRYRFVVIGFVVLLCAYLTGMWINNIQLWPRRALVPLGLIAILAGLAWRESATNIERRCRSPLLVLHLGWSLVADVVFLLYGGDFTGAS